MWLKLIIIMQQFWDEPFVLPSPAILPSTTKAEYYKQEEEQYDHFALKSIGSFEAGTRESEKNEKKRQAGQRSRQKKKNYVKALEEEVRELTGQIENYDSEISKCKDQLVDALKASHNNSNEHAYIYQQLERNALAEDPDLDRVNLLIDVIRNRIGANGTERQANLSYNFKQIVNSMFPAIYRYILNTAEEEVDIFAPHGAAIREGSWTAEVYTGTGIESGQFERFRARRQEFCQRRREAVKHTRQLKAVKEKIKLQGEIFESWVGALRESLTPIQCAVMTLFAERNKLRREFSFSGDFEEKVQLHKKIKTE